MNKTYKHTSIGRIPNDWEVKKLGEISEINKRSLTKSTPSDYTFTYISLSDVDSVDFEISSSVQTFATAPSRARRIVSKDDILMSTVRPNLKGFKLFDSEANDIIASTGFAVISVKNEIVNNNFIFQNLFSSLFERQFYRVLVGSNYPALNFSDVKNLQLPLPPLPEQEAIAACLSTWDTAIEKQSQLINALQQRKKALMQQLLTGKKRLLNPKNNQPFSHPWKEVKLGEVCEITTGRLDANAMRENGKYRFYTCAKEFYRINEYAFDTEALLISGNGAHVGYIHYYKGKFNAYQRTYVLDTFNQNILFVKYFLEKFLHRRIFSEKKEGNTPYIVLSTLSEMNIFLPSIEEQIAIAEVLSTADEELALQKQLLVQYQQQKKALMQQLLTGKKRLRIEN